MSSNEMTKRKKFYQLDEDEEFARKLQAAEEEDDDGIRNSDSE